MNEVKRVAELLQERNRVDSALSACIRRPALTGHLGDWIAAQIFGIELEQGAKGVDGRLADGRTVNVRWNLKRDNLLDLRDGGPDVYLVLSGPKALAGSSRGATRPMVIDAVYLFDAAAVVAELRTRGRKVGVASSVREEVWEAAEVYPRHNPSFALTGEQREFLALFAS
ncbi:hypothetical protein [Lentzea sp. NPDC060358]|uniref:hypothetical protein n=1 Tax=Lentzea sp. NPDC060358 TaxID=3347103 RepID=UPI00366190D0